ncbi:MAG: 3D domain-containing protein [Blastocatellia bacterium]
MLQVGVAQASAKVTAEDQSLIASATSSSISTDRAIGSDNKSGTKAEAPKEASIASPKVGIKNPVIDPRIMPREARLSAVQFEAPEDLGEPLNFRATAYALRGRTRSGAYVRRGVIAADPRVLPLGSVVQVKAGVWSGTYIVHDTGGLIKGNIIDVWVPSNQEARKFGRRKVKLHVLRFGPKGRRAK